MVADAATGEGRVLLRETDPKFWSLVFLGAEPVPSPDGRYVAFVSDRDGYDHAYVVPSGGGEAQQLTHGSFEVGRLAWSEDGKRLVFDANSSERPGARQLMVADLAGGATATRLVALTSGRGTHTGAAFSPDGRHLLYQHTDPRSSADLYVVEAREGALPRRLTDSWPTTLDRSSLVEGELVRYPSADGQPVPAYLFVPKALDRSRKHPAVVWVHGDGITQNYDGWHTRRDYAVYYSFHQYLVDRGYVVLAVDYRGSIGYGRDWRQGHYRDLGGRDYEDIAAGVGYLKTLGYVDTERVGVWGLSYGGFMALQAVTVTPELFRCAIDVAGVPDWRDWYHDPDGPWIRARLGTARGRPAALRSDLAHPSRGPHRPAPPGDARDGRRQRALRGVGPPHGCASEGGKERRLRHVSRRVPLLPARPRPARRLEAGRGLLRRSSAGLSRSGSRRLSRSRQ